MEHPTLETRVSFQTDDKHIARVNYYIWIAIQVERKLKGHTIRVFNLLHELNCIVGVVVDGNDSLLGILRVLTNFQSFDLVERFRHDDDDEYDDEEEEVVGIDERVSRKQISLLNKVKRKIIPFYACSQHFVNDQ